MESGWLKSAVLALVAAWSLLVLIALSGHLHWQNRLLWAPPMLMITSGFLALASAEYEERRAPWVLVAVAAFGSLLPYTVGYVVLFAFSGY